MKQPQRYKKRPANKRSKKIDQKDNDEWTFAHSFIVMGFFAGLTLLVIFSLRTLISLITFSKILAACLFIGMLIPTRYYCKWLGFGIYEKLFFNILGIGPLLCGLILAVNYFFVSTTYTEHRQIVAKKITSNIGGSKVLFILEGGAYKEFSRVRKFDLMDYEKVKKAKYIKYTFAEGLLGFKVMKGHELVE